MTIRINHHRNTALELLGEGLNRFYVRTTLALGSAMVHKHASYSVRVKDF